MSLSRAFVLSLYNNRLARLPIRDALDVPTAQSYPRLAVSLVERNLRAL